MRTRQGNPYDEAHGKAMRCYDWIAPAGTDPHAATVAMEAALPGVKLYHRGDGEVHGFVNTSRRPDGSLYISVQLYDEECDGSCDHGHSGIAFHKKPVNPGQLRAMKAAVGEHPMHRITDDNADEVLAVLGFETHHGAMRKT